MFELKKKFVKIKKLKEGIGLSTEAMNFIKNNLEIESQTKCLACFSPIKNSNMLVCMDCLDVGCSKFEKEAENETGRKK